MSLRRLKDVSKASLRRLKDVSKTLIKLDDNMECYFKTNRFWKSLIANNFKRYSLIIQASICATSIGKLVPHKQKWKINVKLYLQQGRRQDFAKGGADAITVGGLGATIGLWPHVFGLTGSTSFSFDSSFLFLFLSLFLSPLPLLSSLFFFWLGGGEGCSLLSPPCLHPC